MSETIIPRSDRFITVAEYMKRTGLGYQTTMSAIRSGQIKAIMTESGKYRIDTQAENPGNAAIMSKLEEQGKMLAALCRQFNTTAI